ncbi:extracellular solute-binding protein [Geitlerinema sp. PCC 9228]|uniref:extracellular solute-binding protein n=1 Tax=Geitlerinema sp. PCC 9228 TaxID=111611 RepID=UPI0008F9CFB0|nr:extracellular solute-binding protein [Geitlerinema sp. PCC 9228]
MYIGFGILFFGPYPLDRDLFERGYLASWNQLPGLQKAYPSQSLSPWRTKDNEIYGVPLSGAVYGIYYNVDLFDKLALDIPQTWQEWYTPAQTCGENDG